MVHDRGGWGAAEVRALVSAEICVFKYFATLVQAVCSEATDYTVSKLSPRVPHINMHPYRS